MVVDDSFTPIAGAMVTVMDNLSGGFQKRTTTDGSGRYQFNLESFQTLKVVSASADGGFTVQSLDWSGTSTLVKNLRVRRLRTIRAGEPLQITIDSDSSVCTWEFASSTDHLCEWFLLAFDGPGTVTIDARPLGNPGALPRVGWDNPGSVAGATFTFDSPGPVTLSINLAIDRGWAPQRYEVTTLLR
jgi:hypothetical protein